MSAVPARNCCSDKLKGAPRRGNDLALQAQTLAGLLDRDQRVIDIGKGRHHGLAVGLQQFVLPGLGADRNCPESAPPSKIGWVNPAARLKKAACGVNSDDQRGALIAALPGQLDAGKELRAGAADIGRGRRQAAPPATNIRTLRQQFGRQPRRHARRGDRVERSARDVHAFRRPRHQRRQGIDVLRQRLPQRRHRRPLVGEHAFLLRHIEIGAGAGLQPLP